MEAAAPRTIEAAAMGTGALATTEAMIAEAGAPGTTEATMAEAGAPGTTEVMMAEARAPGTTEADVIVARLSAQEVEMKAAEASVAPLVQGPPLLQESAREVEVEVATAQEQLAPLAARVKELEEELTHVASDQDAFRSRAEEATALGKAVAGQLGAEQSAHQLTKESEAEVTQATEASVAVQAVLETKIREHKALKSAARTACEALEVEGVQSGSSLRSHLIALSGQVRERL
ncbi:uncharacterized protein [Miscanthus floridulus]|uniref:uncharacterized protein n=1 Tax=Miscanthus floridulus TaxID=154761 RepID=UPI003457C06E